VNPLVLLILIPLALAALAWAWQIYPRRFLVLWALLPAVMSLGLIVGSRIVPWLIAFDVLLGGVALLDLSTLPRRKHFAVQRETGRIASLRKPHPVKLTVSNRSRRPLEVALRDDAPQDCEAIPEQFRLRLPPQSRSTVSYQIAASRRGAFRMEAVHLRLASRLKLWQRYLSFPAESLLHVYPDMRQMTEYALLARTNRLSMLGVRRARRIGCGHPLPNRGKGRWTGSSMPHVCVPTSVRRHRSSGASRISTRNASSARSDPNRLHRPDARCSTRPVKRCRRRAAVVRKCTTNARCTGSVAEGS